MHPVDSPSIGAWNAPYVLKHIGTILLAAFLCTTASVWAAAPGPECGERVPLVKLIANPNAYHGKALWVVVYTTVEFESMTACPSESDTQINHCLWLTIDDSPYKTDQDYARYESKLKIWKQQLNRQTVTIRATFDKTERGHFSMWPGGLKKITEVSGQQGGWNFTKNAAAPRNCMTGK